MIVGNPSTFSSLPLCLCIRLCAAARIFIEFLKRGVISEMREFNILMSSSSGGTSGTSAPVNARLAAGPLQRKQPYLPPIHAPTQSPSLLCQALNFRPLLQLLLVDLFHELIFTRYLDDWKEIEIQALQSHTLDCPPHHQTSQSYQTKEGWPSTKGWVWPKAENLVFARPGLK